MAKGTKGKGISKQKNSRNSRMELSKALAMEYRVNVRGFGNCRKNVMQTVYIRNNNMDLQSVARAQKDFADGVSNG